MKKELKVVDFVHMREVRKRNPRLAQKLVRARKVWLEEQRKQDRRMLKSQEGRVLRMQRYAQHKCVDCGKDNKDYPHRHCVRCRADKSWYHVMSLVQKNNGDENMELKTVGYIPSYDVRSRPLSKETKELRDRFARMAPKEILCISMEDEAKGKNEKEQMRIRARYISKANIARKGLEGVYKVAARGMSLYVQRLE